MAANPINVVNRLHAVQYDGTNSGDIDNLFSLNNSSENAGVWTFQSPPDSSNFTINTGDWILFAQNQAFSKASNSEFATLFSCNSICADLESVDVGVLACSMGVAPVPSLILSASTTVNVQLNPAMPSSSYTATAFKFAGVSITDLTINSVTVVDQDTVQVGVQNTGLITLAGANILVHAVA